ncbi:brachyurin-like [Aethina tumida]|uniref:brachyurin-like n=1 Tax=Aethina tumida TaxID=116153 RepID=UPI002147BF7A|nr:brachyurin-like [Aethina tumida]
MIFFIFSCLFLLVKAQHESSTTSPEIDGKVIGGNEVVPHSVPYQVAIFLSDSHGHPATFCGGSLIDTRTVLTAAHCVFGIPSATVVLGAHNIRQEEDSQIKIMSTNFTVHEDWDRQTLRNDIALIHLPEDVPLSEIISTIRLATDEWNNYIYQEAKVTGWGKDSDLATAISPVLREADLMVIPNNVCKFSYGYYLRPTNLCTYGPDINTSCQGDSGGPLVLNGFQIGIVSFGNSLCESGLPAVFTRVSKYVTWINAHL